MSETLTELHIQLLWEIMQGGEREAVALAYAKSEGFKEACILLGRPDLPAKIKEVAEKRPAELFAMFRKVHTTAKQRPGGASYQ